MRLIKEGNQFKVIEEETVQILTEESTRNKFEKLTNDLFKTAIEKSLKKNKSVNNAKNAKVLLKDIFGEVRQMTVNTIFDSLFSNEKQTKKIAAQMLLKNYEKYVSSDDVVKYLKKIK